MTLPWILLLSTLLPSLGRAKGLGGCKILDLTHDLDRNNPYVPQFRPFDLQYKQRGPYKTLPYVEWNFYSTYEHLGTHLDAPAHFSKGAEHIEEIGLERLIGEACVMDMREKVRGQKDYLLTLQDIQDWEGTNGAVGPECIVLLNTGRAESWTDVGEYFGTDKPTDASTFNTPGFSGEAASALVSRGVKAVGLDSISLDGSRTKTADAHHAFLRDGAVPGLENVNGGLSKLPARGATVIAAPMKIRGGTGAQTRVFAIGWQENDPCRIENLASAASGLPRLVPLLLVFALWL